MRRTKLAVVALMAAGLLLGASGTAMAAGSETTPTVSPTTETTATVEPTPADDVDITEDPAPTAKARPSEEPIQARPAKPVRGNPSFTG